MLTKIACLFIFCVNPCLSEPGITLLDSWSFNKTLQAFPFSLVKFDTRSPSGPKHEAFKLIAQDLIEEDTLLFGQVLIFGYGSPENHDLAERFGLSQGILPEFIFFKRKTLSGKNDEYEMTRYGGEVNSVSLRRFLKLKTGLWLGLPGCIKELDELAATFSRNTGKDQQKIIQQVEKIVKNYKSTPEISVGKRYLKIMKIVQTKGAEFIAAEINRITKLLTTKLTEEKSEDLKKNLNILKSFHGKRIKDEL